MQTNATESRSEVAQTVTQLGSLGQRFFSRQIDQRSTVLGHAISDIATTIREIGTDIKGRGSAAWVDKACGNAAAYVDRIGVYLEHSDGRTLARDFERYARNQPLAVAAAALSSGFLLSRILRVSAQALTADGTAAILPAARRGDE